MPFFSSDLLMPLYHIIHCPAETTLDGIDPTINLNAFIQLREWLNKKAAKSFMLKKLSYQPYAYPSIEPDNLLFI